jgi:hypothetical protein
VSRAGRIGARVALVLCIPAGACSQPAPSASGSGWEGALAALKAQGTAIYSFRFTSDPPNGQHAQIAIHDASATDACARYSGAADLVSDYWFVDIELGDVAQGDYAIVTTDALGAKGMVANVTLLHRKNGEHTESYPALGGTISLQAALSPGAAKSGKTALGHVQAAFAFRPQQQVGCRGGQAADSSIVDTQCTCRDSSGNETTCVPSVGFDYCCVEMSGARVTFDFGISAEPCASMCRVATGLPDYCAMVQP